MENWNQFGNKHAFAIIFNVKWIAKQQTYVKLKLMGLVFWAKDKSIFFNLFHELADVLFAIRYFHCYRIQIQNKHIPCIRYGSLDPILIDALRRCLEFVRRTQHSLCMGKMTWKAYGRKTYFMEKVLRWRTINKSSKSSNAQIQFGVWCAECELFCCCCIVLFLNEWIWVICYTQELSYMYLLLVILYYYYHYVRVFVYRHLGFLCRCFKWEIIIFEEFWCSEHQLAISHAIEETSNPQKPNE